MFFWKVNVKMRLTKNFMVDDDTALIYWIQLITGLESCPLFISSDRLIWVYFIVSSTPDEHCTLLRVITTLQGAKLNRPHITIISII